MECKPCNKMFSGPVPYQQHIESAKHIKKVASLGLLSTQSLQQPSIASKPVSAYNPLKCDACNISFDSAIHFQSHCLTLEHANNVRDLHSAVNNTNAESVSSTTLNSNRLKDAEIPTTDETDSILPPNQNLKPSSSIAYAECKVCDKQFSGFEPYQQHMASAVHKKKLERQQLMFGINLQSFTCEPCNMAFSGIIPYNQHKESEGHKKKLLRQFPKTEYGFNEAMECKPHVVAPDPNTKELDCIKDSNRPWFCKICLIDCTGLTSFQQHLVGMMHIKKSRMVASLGTYNGITDQSRNDSVFSPESKENSCEEMETDSILSEGGLQFSVISSADVNIKTFYPDQEINFDDTYDGKAEGKREIDDNIKSEETLSNDDTSRESLKSDDEINMVECKLCNLKLESLKEALSHYESFEHCSKKYNFNQRMV